MKTLVSSIFFCIPVCRTGSDLLLMKIVIIALWFTMKDKVGAFSFYFFLDTLLSYYNHILQTATLTSVADCYCEKFSLPPRFLCIKRSV